MTLVTRRTFFRFAAVVVAAPIIVRAGLLMPVKVLRPPEVLPESLDDYFKGQMVIYSNGQARRIVGYQASTGIITVDHPLEPPLNQLSYTIVLE